MRCRASKDAARASSGSRPELDPAGLSAPRPNGEVLRFPGASSCSSTPTGAARQADWTSSRLTTRGANLFHIRDGKVTRLVIHWDRERALADLGLAPEAGSQHS